MRQSTQSQSITFYQRSIILLVRPLISIILLDPSLVSFCCDLAPRRVATTGSSDGSCSGRRGTGPRGSLTHSLPVLGGVSGRSHPGGATFARMLRSIPTRGPTVKVAAEGRMLHACLWPESNEQSNVNVSCLVVPYYKSIGFIHNICIHCCCAALLHLLRLQIAVLYSCCSSGVIFSQRS